MENIKCPHCGEIFTIDESGYAAIVIQIKDKEFNKQVAQNKKDLEEKQESLIQNAVLKAKNESDNEIARLKEHIKDLETKGQIFSTQKNAEIQELKKEKEIAVKEAVRDEQEKIKDLENQISSNKLKYDLELNKKEELHVEELKRKDEEIERIKDFKLKQSTKMIGESLEKYCETEFNKLRATGFQTAYFEKDNDARSGSKGDYIFKDYADDVEYISIMFEMKNENDETKTKHKNEDFFKELDKDRNEKGCEYAVLVSMLESDNEYYNTGIVDVSYRYPKMYVIRPQFFIPVITFLRNAAKNTLSVKKELLEIQNRNIDVATFEASLLDFKDKFGRNYNLANKKFNTAIEEIDKTITHLQKVKEELLASDNQLRLANNKLEDLTIKKLTKNNETMQKLFKESGTEIK